MTNAEKYKDAIMAQMRKTGGWAINKEVGQVVPCNQCSCCEFSCYGGETCHKAKVYWLNAEAEEKEVFSEKDKEVIRALDKVQWVARGLDGIVWGFVEKPTKHDVCWRGWDVFGLNITHFSAAKFAAVKWEDDEPTSREEILGDEE